MSTVKEVKGNNYVGHKESPWKYVGTQIGERITAEEAISLGKLDYEVKKSPNIHRFPDGREIISNESFFTYRQDNFAVLGNKLGRDYQVVQNRESLSVINDILQREPGITIENSGILNGGATSFIALKRERPMEITTGDDFRQYILLCNGFDGSRSIAALYHNERLFCANQCAAVIGRTKNQHKVLIRHTASATERVKEAMKILAIGDQSLNETASLYQEMMKKRLGDKQFRNYCLNLLLTEPEKVELKSGKVSLTDLLAKKPRVKNIMDKMEVWYEEGEGQSSIKGTMFGAFNAVTGYLSNMRGYKSAEGRMDNMIFGTANKYAIEAHYLAMNPEKIKQFN